MSRLIGLIMVLGLQVLAERAGAASCGTEPESKTVSPTTAPAGGLAPTPDPEFEKRLAAIDAAMEKIVDFKANFEQRKYSPLLKRPMVSSGVLTTKGRLVRWETTAPRKVIILIEPASQAPSPAAVPSQPAGAEPAKSVGEMRVYYPADQLCEIYPIDGALSDFAGAPLPRLAELRGRFSIVAAPVSEMGGVDAHPRLIGLLLKPVSVDVRKYLESIRVLIDESIPAATKVIVTDAEGERTEITLSNIRTNTKIKDSEVQLDLPEGVRLSRPLGKGANAGPLNVRPDLPGGAAPAGNKPEPGTLPR